VIFTKSHVQKAGFVVGIFAYSIQIVFKIVEQKGLKNV